MYLLLHEIGYLAAFLLFPSGVLANEATPPPPRHHGYDIMLRQLTNRCLTACSILDRKTLKQRFLASEGNIWEQSGQFEGDIMLSKVQTRNGMWNKAMHWPGGIVPYYINEDFSDFEVTKIKEAMDGIEKVSCIKFRPYRDRDRGWISIQKDSPGCWSYVGFKEDGQIVNLGGSNCLALGVASHELLHALGFVHQQSANNRDKYVTIYLENVKPGKESNFMKFPKSLSSDFGFEYDYGSVMHYSKYTLSKNGKPTILPNKPEIEIGQRKNMSETDIKKVNVMYNC